MDTKLLVIMRGLPWCGKSYRSKEIAGDTGVILSTDDYFYTEVNPDQPDVYNFVPRLLSCAHKWNFIRATLQIDIAHPLVIIDNTNTEPWEFCKYASYAREKDYEIKIEEPNSDRWMLIRELLHRNKRNNDCEKELREWAAKLAEGSKETHNVPQSAIERMMWRWVPTEEINLLEVINNCEQV